LSICCTFTVTLVYSIFKLLQGKMVISIISLGNITSWTSLWLSCSTFFFLCLFLILHLLPLIFLLLLTLLCLLFLLCGCYSPRWPLASFMIACYWSLSWGFCLQFLMPIIFISYSTESSHLIAGLPACEVPFGLCNINFFQEFCCCILKRCASQLFLTLITFTMSGSLDITSQTLVKLSFWWIISASWLQSHQLQICQ
jgi:hypothetical protein